jgi:hypothetical protein
MGCGKVARSGGGVAGWHLKNKKVAFYLPEGGAWQEKVIVNTNFVTPIKEDTD